MAANKVNANERNTTMVAISLVVANIFFICLNGPIKKQVLAIDTIFPNV